MLRTFVLMRWVVTRRGSLAFPAAATLALITAALVPVASAAGQAIRPIDPRFVVVQVENAPLKAGPASVHYGVATLERGQVLRADGETTDIPVFLRVAYPDGVAVFVKAEEVTPEDGGKRLRLNAPSRLRAANLSGGERGHWWFLLPDDAPMPTGAVLTTVETLKTDNRVYGYLAVAPKEARGFIRADQVRDATQEEVEAFLRVAAGTNAPTKPVETAQAPAPKPAEPAPAEPAPAPEPVAAAPTPAPEQLAAPAAPEPAPVAQTPAEADPATEAEPAPPRVATIESLASLFDQAQSQPIREAELDEVMAEFRRAIDALGTSEDDQRLKEYLRARLELLRLRSDLQKSLRAAEELAGSTSKRSDQFASEVSALDQARSYTAVGRLMPSTVYDGRRLPKMYRVQSVDEGFSRTLAYIMPAADDTTLEAKVGRVVGVVGDTQIDPALRVNIVRPKRVDLLAPAATVTPGNGR